MKKESPVKKGSSMKKESPIKKPRACSLFTDQGEGYKMIGCQPSRAGRMDLTLIYVVLHEQPARANTPELPSGFVHY